MLFSWMCKKPWGTHKKNLRDLLRPFIFVHKWRKGTGVVQSPCVFHLNGTALDQVESTVTTLLFSAFLIQCHHSQPLCLECGLGYTIFMTFYFVQTLLSIQFSIHLEWQSSKLCLWFCAVEPCYDFPLITSLYTEGAFTWSQANVEQGSLNGSCSKDKGNFLALCARLIFWNAIQRFKIE